MAVKYFCDKCNKEVNKDDLVLVMLTGRDGEGYTLNNFDVESATFEVCPECVKKIKNINNVFPILDTEEINLQEEIEKVKEESDEFIEACKLYEIGKKTSSEVIEEFFDIIQVSLNVIDRLALIHILEGGLNVHKTKMKKRGWKVKYYI